MTIIQPVSKPSLGTALDTDVDWLKARVTALEAKAVADEKTAVAWLKTNWPHFVTYVGLGYAIVKHVL